MTKVEPHYFIRQLDKERTSVAKDMDGEFTNIYTQASLADCDCPGAIHHRTQCKHMLIRIAWEGLGKPAGVYFTVNSKTRDVRMHKSDIIATTED